MNNRKFIIKSKKTKKCITWIVFLLSILYLAIYLKPSLTDFDENYTLSLIKHSYSQIISLDSMDVHPPLYYFLVKFFINITTFWTSYIPIKILSARILSVIISIITLYFLRKITIKLRVDNPIYIQWVLFLILPNALGIKFPFQQIVDIRMYSLAGLLIVVSFYYLLIFNLENNNKDLIISTIFIILSFYTHYYAAIFGGMLLLCYFVKYIVNKDINKAVKIFISGVIVIISFYPWILIFLKQLDNPKTYWMSNVLEIKEIIVFIILLVMFIYPMMKYYKNMNNKIFYNQFLILIFLLLFVFLFSMIYTIFKGAIFQFRYMYPILLIYEFISINIAFKYRKHYIKYFELLLIALGFSMILSIPFQIGQDMNSYHIIMRYNYWLRTKRHSIIYIRSKNPNYDVNYEYYIQFLHDRFVVSNKYINNFKKNTNIYSNNIAYKKLFKRDYNRIKLN